jgi:hypothetical protein
MCWDWFGGGDDEQQYQEPVNYYYPTPPAPPESVAPPADIGGAPSGALGPSFSPYQSYQGTGYGASSLLGGNLTPQYTGSGAVPTGGWSTAGNAGVIPGAAQQLLRMRQSPQYMWG